VTLARPRLEKHIATDVMAALDRIGCTVSSTQQARASRITEGIPDLYVSHAAWGLSGVWIELKRPGEEPSDVQREWHEQERAAGGIVLVVHSATEAVEMVSALPRGR
jgi:hypothetical protein